MRHLRRANAPGWVLAAPSSRRLQSRHAGAGAERRAAGLRPARRPAPTDSGRPKIVVLGDSLTAGLGLLEAQAYPALLQQKMNARRLRLRGRQRRRLRRHVGRRPAAARLGARRRRPDPGPRARRQRRPARPAGRGDEEEPRGDHRARAGAAHRGAAGRHGGAAELRPRLHRLVSGRSIATLAQRVPASRSCRSCSTGSRAIDGAEPARRHPSQRRGRAASSPTPSGPSCKPMVDAGRRLHDRAARRLENRAERRRACSPSCIRCDLRIRLGPGRRHRRAVGQRQVDAARAARRARRAVDRVASSSTASTSPRSAKTRWRAARREDRLRLPVLPPDSVADGVRERARADGDRRRSATRGARAERCSTKSA